MFRRGDVANADEEPLGKTAPETGKMFFDQIFLGDMMPVAVGVATARD
jgi:hypothetical protein